MRAAILIVAAAALIGAGPPDPEAQIAREIAGKAAGEARRCILPEPNVNVVIVPRTALIYHVTGTTYVSRFARGCNVLTSYSVISTRSLQGRLCENDPVYIGTQGRPGRGVCPLGKFVPYKRVK